MACSAGRGTVVALRHATALVQAGSQIPATGMFGHLVQTATLPGPCGLPRRLRHVSANTSRILSHPDRLIDQVYANLSDYLASVC
jgi:hypothetical protein